MRQETIAEEGQGTLRGRVCRESEQACATYWSVSRVSALFKSEWLPALTSLLHAFLPSDDAGMTFK